MTSTDGTMESVIDDAPVKKAIVPPPNDVISSLQLHLYKPHPFPNPVQGDILEVEDDATVAPKYFLVTASVLLFLIILSLVMIYLFVLIVKWRRKRAFQASNPQPSTENDTTTD